MQIKLYKEGKTPFYAPNLDFYKDKHRIEPAWAPVFYNPRMRLSRDLGVVTVAAYVRYFKKDRIKIVEPLSATGVRGLRYLNEALRDLDVDAELVLNDVNTLAYNLMRKNVKLNNFNAAVFNTDANLLLHYFSFRGKKADIIDIDPFGSPVPFIQGALNALKNGGMLCVTATDMPPLVGIYPSVCLRKYGSVSLKTEYARELAVRILVRYIMVEAGKFGLSCTPLFVQSSDHYVRVCCQVFKNRTKATKQIKSQAYVMHCFKCLYREIVKHPTANTCPDCGAPVQYAGPLWPGKLWSSEFVDIMLEEYEKRPYLSTRGIKILKYIKKEIDAYPLHYTTDELASRFNLMEEPSRKKIVKKLRAAGDSHASLTHFHDKGFRSSFKAKKILELIQNHRF